MRVTYGRGHKGAENARKEKKVREQKRQLLQLVLCLVLFLTVFIGKGVFPDRIAQTGPQLLDVIRANTDFRAAFAQLGRALSEQESMLGELGQFCVEVFAPEKDSRLSAVPASVLWGERLSVSGGLEDAAVRYLRMEQLPESLRLELDVQTPQPDPVPEPEPEPERKVGDVVQTVSVEGEELPENYRYDWLWLGDMETTEPVKGKVTSQFGYRDHPTIGRYAVHAGVDIGADTGDAVVAFADGTVTDVGQDSDFGKYLYIEHANGITTFYSHCSRIGVKEGQQVQVGQKVAEVGSTGKSTGPHLHFEVRLDGVRLDPLHYIRPEEG